MHLAHLLYWLVCSKKKKVEEAAKYKVKQKMRKELYMKLGKIKEKVHKRMNYREGDD